MLKVFVSTQSTQGDAPGDFCFVPDNELVGRHSFVCDLEKADGTGCGCGQAFSGFDTHKGTTTAVVAELDIDEVEWRGRLFQTLCDSGWGSAMGATELAQLVEECVEQDLRPAAQLPIGTVVGRRAWNDSRGTNDSLLYRGMATVSAAESP
jgi:hypothetical protein